MVTQTAAAARIAGGIQNALCLEYLNAILALIIANTIVKTTTKNFIIFN